MDGDADLLSKLNPSLVPPTSTDPDKLTLQEEIDLSPSKQAKYSDKRYIEFLKEQLAYFRGRYETEQDKARSVEPQLAAYAQAAKGATLVTFMVAVFLAVGGGLISVAGFFEGTPRHLLCGFGWVLIIGGLLVQLLGNLLGWPSEKR